MVTRYDVIRSRWPSHFGVKMHVFSTTFNNKSKACVLISNSWCNPRWRPLWLNFVPYNTVMEISTYFLIMPDVCNRMKMMMMMVWRFPIVNFPPSHMDTNIPPQPCLWCLSYIQSSLHLNRPPSGNRQVTALIMGVDCSVRDFFINQHNLLQNHHFILKQTRDGSSIKVQNWSFNFRSWTSFSFIMFLK